MGVHRIITEADEGILQKPLVDNKAAAPVGEAAPAGNKPALHPVKYRERAARPQANLLDAGLFPLWDVPQRLLEGGRQIKKGLFVFLGQPLSYHFSFPPSPVEPVPTLYGGLSLFMTSKQKNPRQWKAPLPGIGISIF